MTELEKKAIDVIRNHSHKLIDNFTQEDLENREISIFLAGYHEGNKANEWHYPSKGEYPKEKGTWVIGFYYGKDNWHKIFYRADGKWWGEGQLCQPPYAWKEIVLPELSWEN